MCEQLMDILLIGSWRGSGVMCPESQPPGSSQSEVFVVRMQSPSFTRVGGGPQFLQNNSDVHQIYLPSGGVRSFMTVVLIINCLILLFGTQGRPRSLKTSPFFFLEKEQGGTKGILYLERPCEILLSFNPPFSLILLNFEEDQLRDKKGKDWGRGVNY